MTSFLDNAVAQDQAGMQRVPVAMRLTNPNIVPLTDPDAAAQWCPFYMTPDGGLIVSQIGGSGSLILLPDDTDGVTPTADNDREPTVARLYALNSSGDFDRLRTDNDADTVSDADDEPALRVMNRGRVYNDFDQLWYSQHGQDSVTIAPSAARTVTTSFGNFVNPNWRAGHFIFDLSASAGAIDLLVTIEARNQTTGAFYPLLTSAAIAATGVIVFKVGIGFTPVANLTANDMVPYIYRVTVTHNNANAQTYSISGNFSV